MVSTPQASADALATAGVLIGVGLVAVFIVAPTALWVAVHVERRRQVARRDRTRVLDRLHAAATTPVVFPRTTQPALPPRRARAEFIITCVSCRQPHKSEDPAVLDDQRCAACKPIELSVVK